MIPELEEVYRRLDGIVRTGVVEAYDDQAQTITIKWPGGTISQPMPFWSSSGWAEAPTPGDQATVLAEGGDPKNARAFIGLSTTDAGKGSKVPPSREDKTQAALEMLQTAFDGHTHDTAGTGPPSTPTAVPEQIPISTDPNWDPAVGASKITID